MALRPVTNLLSVPGAGLPLALGGSLLLHLGILFGVPAPMPAASHAAPSLSVHLAAAVAPAMPSAARAAPVIPQPRPGKLPQQHTARMPVSAHHMLAQAAPASNTAPRATAMPTAKNTTIPAPTYYEGAQLGVPPHLLGELQQVYPARARAADIEGSVTLSLLIDEHGKVDNASVVSAQPPGYFEKAALNMLRNQRFTPALIHNQPVKSRWRTIVRYRLQS